MIKKTTLGLAALALTCSAQDRTPSEYTTNTLQTTTEQKNPCTYKPKEFNVEQVFLNELFDQVKKMNPCVYKLPQVPKDNKPDYESLSA